MSAPGKVSDTGTPGEGGELGAPDEAARLRFALDAAGVAYWDLDVATGQATRSPEHDRIFGHPTPLPDWSYQRFLTYVHPDDRAQVDAAFGRALASGAAWDFECRITRADGQPRWIWARGGMVASHMLGIVADITERRAEDEERERLRAAEGRARAAAEEAAALLDSLLSNAPVGFAFFDTARRYVRINDHLATINGIPAAEHLGRTVEELLPVNALTVAPVLNQVLATGAPVLDLEVTGETPAAPGVTRHWLTGFYPVWLPGDEAVRYVGAVVLEISERKRLERQKDDFISMASHELRTPLTALQGWTQLLQQRVRQRGDTDLDRALAVILRQTRGMTELVGSLLDLSRIQTGKLFFTATAFSLDEVAQEAIAALAATTTDHQITLHGAVGQPLRGDRDRISQALINLLSNAIKYSPRGGEISVSLSRADGEAWIAVSDQGIGIAAEHLPHLFERFYQAGDPSGLSVSGLGIGLFIVAQIVERHGGRIWATSTPGQGATFTMALPLPPPGG